MAAASAVEAAGLGVEGVLAGFWRSVGVYRFGVVLRARRPVPVVEPLGLAARVAFEVLGVPHDVNRSGWGLRVVPPRLRAGSVIGEGEEFRVFVYVVDPGLLNVRVRGEGLPVEVVKIIPDHVSRSVYVPPARLDNAEWRARAVASAELVLGPTYHRFYGAVLSLPSPRRMLYTVLRRLSGLLPGDDAAVLLDAVRSVEAEAVGGRIRWGRVRHEKTSIPVYMGRVEVRLAGPLGAVVSALSLLGAGELTGYGGSPGLGFGDGRLLSARIVHVDWRGASLRAPGPLPGTL